MRNQLRYSLLSTVGVVALVAGASYAAAQRSEGGAGGGSGAGMSQGGGQGGGAAQQGAGSGGGGSNSGGSGSSGPGAGGAERAPDAGAAPGQKGVSPGKSTTGPDQQKSNEKSAADPKSDGKSGAQTRAKSDSKDEKADGKRAGSGDGKDDGKSAGQSKGDREQNKSAAGDPAKGGKDLDRNERSGVGGEPKAERGAAAPGNEKSAPRVAIPQEKRAQVTTGFARHRADARITLDITVNVGVAVPRTARLQTIPEDIVVLVPDYRRYRYFIVDDRVCIVDPDTFVIIDILTLSA